MRTVSAATFPAVHHVETRNIRIPTKNDDRDSLDQRSFNSSLHRSTLRVPIQKTQQFRLLRPVSPVSLLPTLVMHARSTQHLWSAGELNSAVAWYSIGRTALSNDFHPNVSSTNQRDCLCHGSFPSSAPGFSFCCSHKYLFSTCLMSPFPLRRASPRSGGASVQIRT